MGEKYDQSGAKTKLNAQITLILGWLEFITFVFPLSYCLEKDARNFISVPFSFQGPKSALLSHDSSAFQPSHPVLSPS